MGRRRRRAWTPAEDSTIVAEYPTSTGPALARKLGRSAGSVYQRANILGLAARKVVADGPFLDQVQAMHAGGLSDPEMASRLGCERHTVAKHRRSMGLGSNRFHPRQRARVAAKTREQCKTAGLASLGQVRAQAYRDYSAASGWGEGLMAREVHILDALAERGPMTRPEIAAAVGMPWKGSRKSLVGNGPGGSYLATLIRRGLVVSLGRIGRVTGQGRGKSMQVYTLAIDAERKVQRA